MTIQIINANEKKMVLGGMTRRVCILLRSWRAVINANIFGRAQLGVNKKGRLIQFLSVTRSLCLSRNCIPVQQA
jgi:hypothetical protein